MDRLLQLGPNELQSGIFPGVNKSAVLFWADAENVSFADLGVRSFRGAASLTTSAVGVRALAQAATDTTQRVYAGTDSQVVMYQRTSGVWGPTPLHTWATAGQYADLETWGNWLVATNQTDPVQIWKNTGVMAPLAGTTFTRARILKRKLVYMFAINTNNGKNMIEWSDESNLELWTPAPDNMAGNMTIRDLDSEFVAAADLGERLAIYSRNSLVVGTYVGAPNVWGFRTSVRDIGAVSRRSVVSVDPLNYGLNVSGIFMTDGNSYQYLDDPDIRNWIRANIDWGKEHLIWGFHDTEQDCVTWNFQNVGGVWHSVSYDYKRKVFTKGGLQLTAGIRQEVFDYPVVAREGGGLGAWYQSDTHFGAGIPFYVKSKPLEFGTTGLYKLMQLVRVDGTWGGDVKLRIRAHAHPEDGGQIVFDKGLARENYFDYESPYFSFELHGNGNMTLNRMEFFGVPGGIAL